MNFIYFSLGIIFLQIIYVATHYILFRQKEFLYFIFFALSVTAFFMLRIFPNLNPYNQVKGEEIFSSLYGCLLIAFAMYAKFLRIFLDLDQTNPKFQKVLLIAEKIFIPKNPIIERGFSHFNFFFSLFLIMISMPYCIGIFC